MTADRFQKALKNPSATARVLLAMAAADGGLTSLQVLAGMPDLPERTVRDALTRLVARGYIAARGKRVDRACLWHLTAAGASAAAALPTDTARTRLSPRQKPIAIGRVPSVFHLGAALL